MQHYRAQLKLSNLLKQRLLLRVRIDEAAAPLLGMKQLPTASDLEVASRSSVALALNLNIGKLGLDRRP